MNAKNTRHAISTKLETAAGSGSPFWNAYVVTCTPSSPSTCHAPVRTIERPVIVQMTMVSMNVPVMLTRPCLTGSFVLAAAAAMGALPRPASFEKMPRATPFCIAMNIVPTAPPVTAFGANAASTMTATA